MIPSLKTYALGLSFCASLTMGAQQWAAEQPGYEQRMEWFGEAKLGVFLHWGIYSSGQTAESWPFYNELIGYDDYMAQRKQFTANNYRPEEWAKMIKDMGAQYAVLTTKHHDGFALWDTKYSKLNAKQASPAKRDVVTPFVDALRQEGLRVGTYYSLIDWSHPDYPNHTARVRRYEIAKDSARWQRFCKFNMAQLNEVNTRWKPDLIWFDGDWEQSAKTWNAPSVVKMLRKENPNVIINSRLQGYGDYATPEVGVPCVRPKAKYWELCYTMNDSWGFQSKDHNYKTSQMLLTTFVDCLSKGGNMLLAFTPKADGTFPQENHDIAKAFGRWTKKYAEAIYKTQAGVAGDYFIGYTTLNADSTTLYLYLPYRPVEKIQLKAIKNRIKRIREVGSGETLSYKIYNKLAWNETPGIVYIDLPERLLDENITVLAVDLEGALEVYQGTGHVVTAN